MDTDGAEYECGGPSKCWDTRCANCPVPRRIVLSLAAAMTPVAPAIASVSAMAGSSILRTRGGGGGSGFHTTIWVSVEGRFDRGFLLRLRI